MKIKSLALMICATLPSFSSLAGNNGNVYTASEGNAYPAIVVKMKAAPKQARQQLPALLHLHDDSLAVSARFQHRTARGTELSELQALDAKYGFDRYLSIAVPADKTHDAAWINNIVSTLNENPNVEVAYPEAEPVLAREKTKSSDTSSAMMAVQDYRNMQHYLRAPNDIILGYKIGGVNRASVDPLAGSDGANVTIVSNEAGHWNENHINLPKAVFSIGTPDTDAHITTHDTASVGVMAAKDIGTGVKGIAPNAQIAWVESGDPLYNALPKLQAGDVVQISMQTVASSMTGCTSNCYLPMEYYPGWFDIYKALTDKGVHVIEAAGNGYTDLDQSAFAGLFDLNTKDSGAIMVGGLDPRTGGRASFSNYGSRVTSAGWGRYVVSTGYGDLSSELNADYTQQFNGTSSAAPIVAGVVASLSSIAKEHGTIITPKQMRDILSETGTQLEENASSEIGTLPDMGRAATEILNLVGDDNLAPAPTITLDRSTINAVSTTVNQNFPVVATSDQENVTLQWKYLSGDFKNYLAAATGSTNTIVVPSNTTDTQTLFEVTAINDAGKSTQAVITLNLVKPSVSISGEVSMLSSQPVSLLAEANFEQATYTWRLLKAGQPVAGGIDQHSGLIASGLPAGDYVGEVTATSTAQGTRTATMTHNIKVIDNAQNTDAAFMAGLQVNMPSTDNGDSVTFKGSVSSSTSATHNPSYSWTLPSGAQGSNSGKSSQNFTVNKTSQEQTLTVSVTVNAGTESRVLTQTITVPALTVAAQYPTWDSNTAYTTGDKVSWNGGDFQAKWWTRGNEPGTSDAWESLNANQVSEWNSSMAYNGGDIVLFNGHTWKAKWWTKGNQPGTSDVWEQVS